MHDIGHLDTPFYLSEMMLVMPKAIRPPALLVDKILTRPHLGDFRHPIHAHPGQGTKPVFDHLARIDPVRMSITRIDPIPANRRAPGR